MSDFATKSFRWSEFGCKCGHCEFDGTQIDIELVKKLEKIRNELGKPMRINSGIRCDYWNKHVDGREFSQHLPKMGARAADISFSNESDKVLIAGRALSLGLSVGVYDSFLHLDNRFTQRIF